ncbi:MraY family glycosyltransferase [Candidatus Auribacterota bacterium]
MWNIVYLYIFLFSLLASTIFTFCSKKLAIRYGFLDQPNQVKFHTNAKPLLGGGVAIFFACYLTILLNFIIVYLAKDTSFLPASLKIHVPGIFRQGEKLSAILLGGVLMMLLGLYDDKKCISPYGKLLSQILIASVLFFLDVRITLFINNLWINYLITCGWVIFIINSFNLLDNIDGLSAGICFISALLFFAVASALKQYFISVMLLSLAGSLLGFLFYNFNPASIFMGDCGSLFIGYMMSVLTIQATYLPKGGSSFIPLITPVLILAIPLYDTFSVIIIRIKTRTSIFKGDKNHFSHRLVRLGMSARGAVLFLYLVSFAIGISATILPYLNLASSLVLLIQAVAIILIVALLEYFGKSRNAKKS